MFIALLVAVVVLVWQFGWIGAGLSVLLVIGAFVYRMSSAGGIDDLEVTVARKVRTATGWLVELRIAELEGVKARAWSPSDFILEAQVLVPGQVNNEMVQLDDVTTSVLMGSEWIAADLVPAKLTGARVRFEFTPPPRTFALRVRQGFQMLTEGSIELLNEVEESDATAVVAGG